MKKRIVRRDVPNIALSQELDPLLNRIYVSRGVQSMNDLEKSLSHLAPYSLLANIEQAVSCLEDALRSQAHIMIIGDFDADGATSTALAVRCLRQMGAAKVSFLVPNRFEFGYGLTPEIVAVAALEQPDVLLTVDNGISSHEGVIKAHELGLKVIITDHHLPGSTLPAADALINPNLTGDKFPSKNLAGVGVIFYVMLALRAHLRSVGWFEKNKLSEPNMATFLDLVALGTVADVVPLDQNNRILVHQGLSGMRAGRLCPGLRALLDIAGKDYRTVHASDLGFAVAPRLNAAGRLVDMRIGIQCLLADDDSKALQLAAQLDGLNKERQQIEEEMRGQAYDSLATLELQEDLPLGLCLYDESWHQGIIGILASRVKEVTGRPVFAFAHHTEQELKGSGRSITGVHLKDLLERIATAEPKLMMKFGGHAMAAGLSIQKENLPKFSDCFQETLKEILTEEQLVGMVHTDGMLPSSEMTLSTASTLKNAGPWGAGFPEPLFDGHFKVVTHKILKEKHIKLILEAPEEAFRVEAIAFNQNHDQLSFNPDQILHVAYRLDINEYQGNRKLQLLVEYFDIL